ncbi:MAG: plasmid encoded RepA protein [Treponema sp.]|nr:plasmid encoded RepA protein [Treponema sp.]
MGEELALIPVKPEVSAKYRSFLPSVFISAALPLRDVKRTVFERRYNNITLRLTSGVKVPFGKYGRLLLSVLTTHAVVSKNNLNNDGTVTIRFATMQGLLDELQLPKQRSGDIKEQLACFANSSFIYEERRSRVVQKKLFPEFFAADDPGDVTATKVTTGIIPFIDTFQYIELDDAAKKDKRSLAFTIVLDKKFIQLCKEHSVPIDYSVYRRITSPLGKDLYAWLVYRNNYEIGDEGLFISRPALVQQFMPVTEKSNPDQERTNFVYIKEQINIIKEKYYPGLRVSFGKNNFGFTLYKSPQIMAPKDERYILVTSELGSAGGLVPRSSRS